MKRTRKRSTEEFSRRTKEQKEKRYFDPMIVGQHCVGALTELMASRVSSSILKCIIVIGEYDPHATTITGVLPARTFTRAVT